MTPTQQAAYLALAEAKDETTWRAALPAFKASVEGGDPDNAPLQALCMALEFIARIAAMQPLDRMECNWESKLNFDARELLGWQ
jgi:hypothetical protein